MGACLNSMVCIRSAREEGPFVRRFAAWAPREWSFCYGLHFGCCIYMHHTGFESGTALLYTSDRQLTQIHSVYLVC